MHPDREGLVRPADGTLFVETLVREMTRRVRQEDDRVCGCALRGEAEGGARRSAQNAAGEEEENDGPTEEGGEEKGLRPLVVVQHE